MKKLLSLVLMLSMLAALIIPVAATEAEPLQLYTEGGATSVSQPAGGAMTFRVYKNIDRQNQALSENFNLSKSGDIGNVGWTQDDKIDWNASAATPGASGTIFLTDKSDASVVYAIAVSATAPFLGVYTSDPTQSLDGFVREIDGSFTVQYAHDTAKSVYIYLGMSGFSFSETVTSSNNVVTAAKSSERMILVSLPAGNTGNVSAEIEFVVNSENEEPVTERRNICFTVDPATVPQLPQEGLYYEINENTLLPVGDPIERVNLNGPFGYRVEYDDSASKTVYYYRPNIDGDSCTSDHGNISTQALSDDLFSITIAAGSGSFAANVFIRNGNGDGPGYPFECVDTSIEKGLFYKRLLGVNENNPSVDMQGEYRNSTITLPLYEDRADIATFFYDGENFVPVEVRFSDSLAVDVVTYEARPGWYVFMAYDFGDGYMTYVDDNGTPENAQDDVSYSIEIQTHVSEQAFYAENSATDANFRMYTFAQENTSELPQYAAFKYEKRLYLLSSDENYEFDESAQVTYFCRQRQYLPNGNETDDIEYTDFTYDINYLSNGPGTPLKGFELTIYTNDSDVLFFLRGEKEGQWQFGSYVNILAPDDENSLAFNMNNQGAYASAKFLPKHIFDELAVLETDVTLKTEGFTGGVTCDKNMVSNIAAENKPVTFYMGCNALNEEQKATVQSSLSSGETILDALEFQLYFGETYKHDLGGNNAKATIHYDAQLPNNTIVHVYYLNDLGELEEMEGEYKNGKIVFSSNHFSSFVLTTETSSSSGEIPPYTPPAAEKPKHTFADVSKVDWYADAVQFNFEKNYVTGVSETSFAPEATMTRGMMMTLLARICGVDTTGGEAWYEKGVNWAISSGVSDGTELERQITREEMITMLWRALGSPKVASALDAYKDTDQIASYCVDAMNWAVSVGLVKGVGGDLLAPGALTNRAQAAQLIYNHFA